MCGRFSILSNSKTLAEHFALLDTGHYVTSFNMTPASNIPTIRYKIDTKNRELVNCHWGLIPHWLNQKNNYKPINARAETITEKPYFRDAFKKRRCLIPANGFYEWKGSKGHKQPYYFKLQHADLFAFAGLWEYWQKDDSNINSCVIITTEANSVMKTVHDRMPVIIDPAYYNEWLETGSRDLLVPYPGEMTCYPVSKKINNPGIDSAELIETIE